MQVRLPGRRTATVHAFPTADTEFAADVAHALETERAATTDPEELRLAVNAALHRRYPNAKIVAQSDLGALIPGSETWYAYRDAGVRPTSEARERLYRLLAASRRTVETSREALQRSETVASDAGFERREPRELEDRSR